MKSSMLVRRAGVGFRALVLSVCLGSSTAFAASSARVVILETSTVDLPGLGANALTAGVATALQGKGAEVVPSSKLRAELLACTSPSCYVMIADVAGATHVLRIEGAYANDGYTLQVELWDSRTGKVSRSERYHCDLCSPTNMVSAARDQATLLWVQDATDAAASPTAPTAPIASVHPPGADISPAPTDKRRSTTDLIVGGSLAAVGLGAVALGSFYLYENGRKTDCETVCRSEYDARGLGLGTLIGGLAVGGVGAWFLWTGISTSHEAAVAVGPAGISIAGKF